MSKGQATGTNNDSSLAEIDRTAIDSSGNLGSLYNGFRDNICEQLKLGNVDKSTKPFKLPKSCVKSVKKNQNCNLLRIISIPQEMRLSILLNLAEKTRIASILEYTRPVNEHTRFLCYSYVYKREKLPDKLEELQKTNKISCPKTDAATHIITAVTYGIDAVVVLQLPSDVEIISNINDVLEKVATILNNGDNDFTLTAEEKTLLEGLDDVMVYSNISYLIRETKLLDICSYLTQNKDKFIDTPTMYTLCPITYMFTQYNRFGTTFVSLPPTSSDELENVLLHLLNTVNDIKYCLDSNTTGVLREYLEGQLRDIQRQYLKLMEMYKNIVDRLQKWLSDKRKQRSSISGLDKLLQHKDHTTFDHCAKTLREYVHGFQEKENLIIDLNNQKIEYCNVAELNLTKQSYERTLKCKLKMNDRNNRILCTSDTLNKRHRSKLNDLHDQLITERKTNPNLCLTYADFTYTTIEPDMRILTSNKKNSNENIKKKRTSSSITKTKTSTSKQSPSSTTINDNINILLLGETGVGKSTFINALVNYLKFVTFEQAESNEPVVLIPVSFMMTIGDNFEERTIKFGDLDNSQNEDFNHAGESVTQHCKSYEFHLTHNDGKKLCIIDTPGFGDTRGLDQDDLNMQDILKYINNLTHLNAVCFLLKPNVSELHTFFRMCFTELIDLLGPNVHANIIFCFTNARSTFYTPGDTAPLVKRLLKSLSMNDIPFKKENTFCFDNKSFRYLVALQNGIEFNNEEEHDYKMSWSTSVRESNRLIEYIRENLTLCRMDSEWQSIKRAQVEIADIIRPMLQTMRNILRNIVLCKANIKNKSIEMTSKPIHRPAEICLSCLSYPIKLGNLWIARDIPHEFQKNCLVCSCSHDEHVPINYVLNYSYSNTPASYQENEMIDIVYELCTAGADFDYFLSNVAHSQKGDPFLMGLTRMIVDENNLCENQKPNNLNLQLFKDLTELKYKYEERSEYLKTNKQQTTLTNVHKWITTIHENHLIQEQLKAIKETQKMMAEPYEITQD